MSFGSAFLSISPWQEFVDPVDLVIGDVAEDISQPGLRDNVVELCRLPWEGEWGEAHERGTIFHMSRCKRPETRATRVYSDAHQLL